MMAREAWRVRGGAHEGGQGLAEYALILVFIAIVAIVALGLIGTQISSFLSEMGARI
jgi:Flp pilus assembly pilin Flp